MRQLKIGTVCSGIEAPIQALESLGVPFDHLFSCESDTACQQVIHPPVLYDDMWDMSERSDLPYCDILVAGLPCQAFSNIGQQGGLDDPRGLLFIPLCNILRKIQPKYLIFENVLNMLKHNDGKSFWLIQKLLETHGYVLKHAVLKSSDYGLPQMRKRVYVVGYHEDDPDGAAYEFPEPVPLKITLDEILGGKCSRDTAFTLRVGGRCSPIDDRHNWDGYWVDGKEMRIGPEHACRLQGFPKDFYDGIDISDTEKMKQMGNTMTVPVMSAVISNLLFNGVTISEILSLSRQSSQ